MLYLICLETDKDSDVDIEPNMIRLAPRLYLVDSDRTRSQVYHAFKREFRPGRLLVAPLAADPKFKGMNTGALAWLRARQSSDHCP